MDTLLTLALQGAFFAVFAAVAWRFVRRPNPLNRDLLIVFASVAGLFLVTIIRDLIDGPEWLRTAATVLLIAQPFLTVRLVGHFAPLPRWAIVAVAVAFVVAAALVIRGITGDRPALLYVVGYFVIVNTVAALRFFAAAKARIGVARTRLALAGAGTILFAACILIAGAGAATADGSESTSSVASTLSRIVALLAGLGYLLAFATPLWFRRIQQQAVAFRLDQELLATPATTDPTESWAKLAAAGRRLLGGRAALIVEDDAAGTVLASEADGPIGLQPRQALGAALPVPAGPTVTPAAPGPLRELAKRVDAGTAITVPLTGSVARRGTLVVLVTGSPLFVDDDVALLTALASRTITSIEREEALADRSALIATLRRTNEELARASAAKSDFLAAMSHELRTPLNAIIGFSELLMAPVGDLGRRGLDVVDQAGHIHGAGLQLLDLINEVLDLARVEAGRLELHRERFDVAALVRRTIDSMRPLADRRRITVQMAGVTGAELEADPNRVRQVIYNLVSNAIKFSPDGGTVRIEVGEVDGQATIAVTDDGPGIPAAEQGLVFEAFSQGALGRARTDGAGLGLALSRQLAEAHGGGIDLDSTPGHGSTFTLRLPLVAPLPSSEKARRDGRRLVLIVEDDAGSVALLRSWLEPEGYAVAVATTGEDGLDLARNLVPDAILLDILLPGLDGWDVLQQLRTERRTRGIPILIVSVVEDRQLGLALGAADYFVKPVDREPLLERLRWATRTQDAEGPLVVLAIDEDDDAQAAYRSALDGAARVVAATSAEDGLRLAREVGPHAILLDLGLREASPFGLLARLKDDRATREVPVFALATHPLSDTDKERLTGQVVAILQKEDAAAGLATWLGDVPEQGRTALRAAQATS